MRIDDNARPPGSPRLESLDGNNLNSAFDVKKKNIRNRIA